MSFAVCDGPLRATNYPLSVTQTVLISVISRINNAVPTVSVVYSSENNVNESLHSGQEEIM